MHVFMKPAQAAKVLGIHELTVRNRIRSGAIKNVVTNGCEGNGIRYLIDMTKEFGIEEVQDARNQSGAA